MSEKSKLYVFEKKEVALIFVFMLLIALTAFMLGVRIGKNYSFEASGYSPEDRQRIEMLSTQEEMIQQMLESEEFEPMDEDELNRQMHDALRDRIREQLRQNSDEDSPRSSTPPARERESVRDRDLVTEFQNRNLEKKTSGEEDSVAERKSSPYSGKFTIQLGSYRRLSDAEDFASGFAVRGYDPIINEVEIPNRGTWYRVSLGAFNTSTEAKNYIESERELFQGQDYVIGRFD